MDTIADVTDTVATFQDQNTTDLNSFADGY